MDSFYGETINNFEKRKADGRISVEVGMDSIKGITIHSNKGTQHDARHFEIALTLADYVTEK